MESGNADEDKSCVICGKRVDGDARECPRCGNVMTRKEDDPRGS